MKEISLFLTVDEVNAILAVLGDLPTKSGAFPLVLKIKEQAVAWTKKALGDRVKEFEDRVIEQIERQRTPQPQSIVLPLWV